MPRPIITTTLNGRNSVNFLMTQALDFLMTQDDNFLVLQDSSVLETVLSRRAPITTNLT